MNFGFTEEQEMLRDQVRKFLDKRCPIPEVRKISNTKPGYSAELWQEMASLGWLGLTISEEFGGSGLGWVDMVVLLEETGRTLYPSPFISNALAATVIAEQGNSEQKQKWLPKLADGSLIGTVAILEADDHLDPSGIQLQAHEEGDDVILSGEKHFVSDAAQAALFVVACRTGSGAEDISLVVIESETEGLKSTDCINMDQTKREGMLTLSDVYVKADAILGERNKAWPAIARLIDCGAVAVTAEMIGAAEAALSITTQYAKDRIQFGSPIGRYQGVKHPLADMYVDIESFKSLLYYASWTVDESPDELPRSISLAKAYASESFPRIGVDCIQLHGAIGYTAEYDIQLFLKRSKWARPKFGDADFHYDRVATLGGV